jgi:DNA-binding transcriptional LysR family regulator
MLTQMDFHAGRVESLPIMELRHLRYFQAVAEELSFSKAARRLRIAQPALSRAVQEMEREIGTQLIEPERKSPRLTPAGAVLLHETGLILERLEESMRLVRRTAEEYGMGDSKLRQPQALS